MTEWRGAAWSQLHREGPSPGGWEEGLVVTGPCLAPSGRPLAGASVALSFLLQFHPRGLEFALLGHGLLFKTPAFCFLCSLFWERIGGEGAATQGPHTQRISSLALGFSEELFVVPGYEMPFGLAGALELEEPTGLTAC